MTNDPVWYQNKNHPNWLLYCFVIIEKAGIAPAFSIKIFFLPQLVQIIVIRKLFIYILQISQNALVNSLSFHLKNEPSDDLVIYNGFQLHIIIRSACFYF